MNASSARLAGIVATALALSPLAQAQTKSSAAATPDPPSSSSGADGWGRDPAETETLDDAPSQPASGETAVAEESQEEPEPVEEAEPPRVLPPWRAGGDLVVGFGDIRASQAGKASFTALSLIVEGAYRAGPNAVGLRLPYTSATVTEGDNPSSSHAALGNLELWASHVLSSSRHFEVPVGLALSFPLGGGDPYGDETAMQLAAVQQTAAASRGFEDNPLFVPKHFAASPSIGFRFEKGRVRVEARERIEIVLRAGSLKPPEPIASNMLAIGSLTSVSGLGTIVRDRAWAGLRAWLHYDVRESYEADLPGVSSSKTQAVLEPEGRGRLGPVEVTLGYLVPLGGRLGDASVHGLRIRAVALF